MYTFFLIYQILIDERKASGVSLIKDDMIRNISARKEVILSAGSINGPQILMLSGIGPKDHLTQLGVQRFCRFHLLKLE
jgi:choline dehydrogenase-like flavoprotein